MTELDTVSGMPSQAAAATSERTVDGDPFALAVARPLSTSVRLESWMRLVRPRQWLKNTFVVAPLLFSGLATDPRSTALALSAFALFSLLASGVYCWNDVVDRLADQAHPTKRGRPVAAGLITARAALLAGSILIVGSIGAAWTIGPGLGAVLLLYLVLNVLYTTWLKHLVIVDVFTIASFFILRLLAGCAAIEVRPSLWLLLCGGLLALYLGFAKRRHELLLMGAQSTTHRTVLAQYSAPLLDQMSVILLSVTIVSYIMYTLSSRTASLVGSEALAYSTVFVLYGVFRYLYLVHRADGSGGGDPAETLLTDPGLILAVVTWLAYCGWVIYRV